MGAIRPRDRKVQIARAAERLFCEFGYRGVGVDAVAAEVGIGGSALYRHYRGKQELLADVVFAGLARVANALADIGTRASSIDELLSDLAAVVLDERGVPLLWQREVRHLRAEDQGEVRRRTSKLEDRLGKALSTLEPAEDPERLRARAVLAVFWSPSYHHAAPPRPEFESLLAGLAATAWRSPLPPAHARETPPPGTAGPVPRASRREMILAIAGEMFAERGFAEVSVDEIGAALEVTGASVYRHFATKGQLLHAALWRGAEALHLSLSQALAGVEDPHRALEQVLSWYVHLMVHHRGCTQLLITEVLNLTDQDRPSIVRAQREYVAEWVHLLRQARPELSAQATRVVVHATLTVINDLLRMAGTDGAAAVQAPTAALGLGVLHSP